MITAGIDVGNETVKAAIIGDEVLAYSIVPTADESAAVAQQALAQAVERAGLSPDAVQCILATGAGGAELDFVDGHMADVIAVAKGIHWLLPSVRTVIDMGAEGCIVATCDEEGIVIDYDTNQKCGSGTGMFLEVIADALEVGLDDIGELSLSSTKDIPITSACAVFAESEVVSLVHSGTDKVDILRGIHNSIAARTASMVQALGMERDVALVGGVARNKGLVDALKRQINTDVLVPELPEIVSALGAALAAREKQTPSRMEP